MNARGSHSICFVLPSLAGGGAERAAVQILNALDPAVWERSMYLAERTGPYLGDLDPAIAVAAGSGGSRARRWADLRSYLRARRPEIVVSFLSYFSVLAAARAARVGTRVVFNQQTPMSAFLTDNDYAWRRPWHRRLFETVTRIGYRLADAVFTTSAGVADDLVQRFGVDRPRIRVLHNPVDLAAVAAAAAEPLDEPSARLWQRPVIVAAGRLADAKNYPLMIDALVELRKSIPATLFILGTGEREGALRAQIERAGLQSAVVLCGFQQNPWKYIARADAFVLTSRYEGFGNVLIEAMGCGVPAVATISPGTSEIIDNGRDGLLAEHSAGAIAAALRRVLSDPQLRGRLSDGARQSAERFALRTVAADYDRALRAILS